MANDEHLQILLAASSSRDWSRWNQWRREHATLAPDLKTADLQNMDLSGADLSHADLRYAQLQRADLTGANLTGADLRFAELRGTNFTNARLTNAMADPSALRRALNAKIDFTESKGVGWQLRRGGKRVSYPGVSKRLLDLIKACRSWISRLAPGLFEHEELVTLGLSQHGEAKNDQLPGHDTQSQQPVKPDENRK